MRRFNFPLLAQKIEEGMRAASKSQQRQEIKYSREHKMSTAQPIP
jgi:hypothetical protein